MSLVDDHSVLLWQTCAYADDLSDAVSSGQRLTPAYDALLEFLHYRLLPYLSREEWQLPPGSLRDEQLSRLLITDHERLRADVDNVESSRTRRLVELASQTLVDRLERHVRREESWVVTPAYLAVECDDSEWAVPLLLGDEIDVDTLPVQHRDTLLRHRLQQMRRSDTIRLSSSGDLHGLWRHQHGSDPDSHVWAYEQEGPRRWVARITRRDTDTG